MIEVVRPTPGIRVLTLNVLSPEYGDWTRRREVLAAGLRALRPDVVGLQEVVRTAGYDGVEDLLGDGYHVVQHPTSDPSGVTAALASRWPFGEVHQVPLDVSPRVAEFPWAGAMVAEVLAPGPIGSLILVHHKPVYQLDYEREREQQAVETARSVEHLLGGQERHVVLLGDFDAAPGSASIRFWTGRQSLDGMSVCYHDTWRSAHPDDPGHTFTPANELVRSGSMPLVRPRRIDYVMVRGNHHGPTLQVRSCERTLTEPVDGVQASDHYGVLAELVVPDRPPGTTRSLQP